MLKGEKILITGPASSVGFPIARELAKDNEVYGLARFGNPVDLERVEGIGVKCLKVDLAQDSFDAVPNGFTYALHFAVVRSGEDNFAYDLAANSEGTGRLMSHCRNVKAYLHCSSVAVYQSAGRRAHKEDDPLGDSCRAMMPTYSISKIASESMARFGAREWNIPTTIARLGAPFGDNGGWPSTHLDLLAAGKDIPLHPDKPTMTSLVHEDDYVGHIPKLLEIASVPAFTLNWAGVEVRVEDWCEYMGQITGIKPKIRYTLDQTLQSSLADTTLMETILGKPKTDWHDGLRRMVQARHPELKLRA